MADRAQRVENIEKEIIMWTFDIITLRSMCVMMNKRCCLKHHQEEIDDFLLFVMISRAQQEFQQSIQLSPAPQAAGTEHAIIIYRTTK
jgi:hypothetical protein